MTWLKGQTTWVELPQKIARLLCGEVADDVPNTLSSGDRWVREFTRNVTDGVLNATTTLTSATAAFTQADKGANMIGTGIPAGTVISSVTNSTTVVMSAAATTSATGVTVQIAHDTLRMPTTLDVSTGNISDRCGYFNYCYSGPSDNNGVASREAVCKLTAPFSSDPSSSGFHRWAVTITVTTANTTPGNYSTAVVREQIVDADSGTLLTNANRSPNAAGLVTGANGLQYTVSDTTGTLLLNTVWQRGFTATYMYGIDTWPMLHRQGGTAPTFSVAPPGSAGTDYDIVRIASPSTVSLDQFNFFAGNGGGNLFHGLGIKTATGLGANPLYTFSFSMARFKGRIFANGGGILALHVGQSMVDAVNGSVFRLVGSANVSLVSTWIRCAATAGSVTNSTAVQYWLSAKADGIVLVLNMDPGSTGKMGSAAICSFVASESTYDSFPVAYTATTYDYSVDQTGDAFTSLSAQYRYMALKRRQDGSEGSRDWQTKWQRKDLDQVNSTYVSSQLLAPMGMDSGTTNFGGGPAAPIRQNKPAPDGKWWLYGFQYGEGGSGGWGGVSTDEARMVRGAQNSRYFWIPGDSWASGDELTDSVTSAKYFLVMPDYVGVGARWRVASNSYQGGLAVAEV